MKLIPLLLIALLLTGCAVADADYSAPVEQVEETTVEAIEVAEPTEIGDAEIEELKKSVVTIYADFKNGWSQGTAVAVGNNEYLTAYHAAQEHFTNIRTIDGDKLTLDTFDIQLDIATLKSTAEAVPVKIGNYMDSRAGDEVIIIGSPDGKDDTVIRTTIKVITNKIVAYGLTGAGSSGGGMFNMKGELIGIVIGGDEEKDEAHAIPTNKINKLL
jgi:S1-C subfamily serine protease